MFKNGSGDPSIAKSKPIMHGSEAEGVQTEPKRAAKSTVPEQAFVDAKKTVLRAVMVVGAVARRRVPSHSNRSG